MVGKDRWWASSLANGPLWEVGCGQRGWPRRTAGDDDKDGHNTGDPDSDWQFHSQLHSINIMNILDDKQSTHSRFATSLCPNSVARSPARSLARSRCWSFDRYIITNCRWRASSLAPRGGPRARSYSPGILPLGPRGARVVRSPVARMPLLLQLLHACSLNQSLIICYITLHYRHLN